MALEEGSVLAGARVISPHGTLDPGWVRIAGGLITEVGAGAPTEPCTDLTGHWLVPGFVDIHCHGGGGGSFTSTDPKQAHASLSTHLAHGTTTLLASLVSAPLADLIEQVRALGELVGEGALAGIHLEGPFLSPARCGAHDPAALRPPEPQAVERLLVAGQGTITMVTLAPELEHSRTAVRQLVERGVIAALGHTDAVFDEVLPAVEAGASVATHLFNGMRPLHHREPGPIGALLDDERVTVELICDLVHLHPAVAGLAARYAGNRRTVLVTDAISATSAGDGIYALGPQQVTVSSGEPRLADGSLAGSTLTMDAAFRNLVLSCGVPVADAVAASATRPAELLGLSDRVGSIRAGLAADLVVLDADLRLRHVMRNGQWSRESN